MRLGLHFPFIAENTAAKVQGIITKAELLFSVILENMSLNDFATAHLENAKAGSENPHFTKLMAALDEAYRAAIRAMPPDGIPVVFGKFLLICDKAMRAASVLVAARHPEDSVAITRRAIEAAKTTLAIKLNAKNADNWLAESTRSERWSLRLSNEKPKSFQVHWEDIKSEPLINELETFLGIISDAYVHFTPEFYSSLAWEIRPNKKDSGGAIFLQYFHTDEREIERHYIMLAAVHTVILKAFDKALDGQLSASEAFAARLREFTTVAKTFSDEYTKKYAEKAEERF